MNIDYNILQDFLRCNKQINLKFREDSNILDVLYNSNPILTLTLDSNDIKSNSELIYNSITNLDDITMYIPKIYTK